MERTAQQEEIQKIGCHGAACLRTLRGLMANTGVGVGVGLNWSVQLAQP